MIHKLRAFFREYLHFGLVIIAIIIALGLDIAGYDRYAHFILGASALFSSIPILKDIYDSLKHRQYGVDILAATAIITSVLLGEYWAGMIIVLMLTGGEALEDYAENRAKTELTALLDRAPKKAHVLRGRKTVDIAVGQVKVGDKLIIKPGEVVPVDATIVEGRSSFDESSLTGESLPLDKAHGDTILSGSINVDSSITVKALHTAKDSQYEQIIQLVKAASSSQSPFVRLADHYSVPFTIIAFVIAGGAWILSGDVLRFLQVLVVATPCPLILAAPIALISGMSRAARHGVIIKNGGALERLAAVQTVGFDKTGTLTQGEPIVHDVSTFNSFSKKQVLEAAGALEQNSPHILAKAIVNEALKNKYKLPKTKGVVEKPGYGVSGVVERKNVLVGKLNFMKDQGIPLPAKLKLANYTKTASFVAIDGVLAGSISFMDEIRPEAKGTLSALKRLGVKHLLMVTGDNKSTANAIAKQIGITDVTAEALPADKLLAIENVAHKPVAFVGDGVNDAPVLTAADVGIALGARGSTAASESADVVVMLDDLSRVSTSIEIAQRTFKIAKQSILIGIFISIGLMFIFASGRFAPVYGAAIQEVVDIIVIINALRAHGSWQKARASRTVQAS